MPESTPQPKPEEIYYNPPQMHALMVNAQEGYHVWGRGTGKSSGLLAWKVVNNITEMPRSTGMIIGETYMQLLTRTLPSLISGLAKLGYYRELHYFIGRRPPKSWKWEEPYEAPVHFDHFIIFYNGCGAHLVSQDRKGSSNGINSDWIIGDEAKYLDYQQFMDESLPTMRANRAYFGDLSCHRSICFTTSMPTAAEGKWILKKKQETNQTKVLKLEEMYEDMLRFEAWKQTSLADQLRAQMNEKRKNMVHYSAASTLENVKVLGMGYIKQMERIMPRFIFETEILNIEPASVEGGFYPFLDAEGKHGYSHSYHNPKLEQWGYDLSKRKDIDSRLDADCIPSLPLRIGVDWGATLSSLSVAQDLIHTSLNEYRFINAFYVKHPQTIDHLASMFCDYYEFHGKKELIFCYDPQGNKHVPNSVHTYAEEFTSILRKRGWVVILRTKAAYHTHGDRYLLWSRLLAEDDSTLPKVRFNKRKAAYITTSMANAPAIEDPTRGTRKDKNMERNKSIDQLEATHFSDSADYLVMNDFEFILRKLPGYVPSSWD